MDSLTTNASTAASEGRFILGSAVVSTLVIVMATVNMAVTGSQSAYGRYSNANPRGGFWVIPISPKMTWFLMEIPNLALGGYLIYINGASITDIHMLFPVLFLFHYVLRVFVFGMLLRGGRDAPILIVVAGALFTTVNGTVQVAYHARHARYPEDYMMTPKFLIGMTLFCAGMAINHHSDTILRNLRKDNTDKNHYIPRGGVFELVSGANFFGESVEWLGYAIAADTPVAYMFLINTVFTVGIRAWHHHQWYHDKFKEEYPKNRKAFIPFLF